MGCCDGQCTGACDGNPSTSHLDRFEQGRPIAPGEVHRSVDGALVVATTHPTATSMPSNETASILYPIKIEAIPDTPKVLLSFAGGLPYLCADLQQAACLALSYPAWVGSDAAPPQYSRLGEAQT